VIDMTDRAVAAWTAALDELERFLDALQASVSPSDAPEHIRSVPALPLPPDLGPIPVQVRVRAAIVLEKCRAFEADMQAGLATAGRELHLLDRMKPEQQPARAVFLDQGL
jgi:hypothetical protein